MAVPTIVEINIKVNIAAPPLSAFEIGGSEAVALTVGSIPASGSLLDVAPVLNDFGANSARFKLAPTTAMAANSELIYRPYP